MVIGNGMIAKACKAFIDDTSVTIFASGVSNSAEVLVENFQREFELLASQTKDIKIVYFSTCSVNDPSVADTPYVRHKKNGKIYQGKI